MSMKCCTKLETSTERCPIVFQGHPSNFKVTRDKTSPILTQIGRFQTIGQSQLSNPSDLPCFNQVDYHNEEGFFWGFFCCFFWGGGGCSAPMHLLFGAVYRSQGRWGYLDVSNVALVLNESIWISIEISLKFVPKGPINNIPALVQIMAWHRPGDKPLSEPMLVCLLMHLCVTRPQWVNILLSMKTISCHQSLLLTMGDNLCPSLWILDPKVMCQTIR